MADVIWYSTKNTYAHSKGSIKNFSWPLIYVEAEPVNTTPILSPKSLRFGSQDASAWPPLETQYLPHTLSRSFWHSHRRLWNHPVDETWPGWCGLPHTLTLDLVQWVEAQSGPLPLASLLRLKLTVGFTFAWGEDSPNVDLILQYSYCSDA